jgi:hypothetical protein
MKGYNSLYYLLFVILIMGAFASMAQNTYGLTILGGVAITFTIIFLIQFITSITAKRKKDLYSSIELGCLCVLTVILAMRVFYINLSYIESFFGFITLLLILLYFRKMINSLSFLKQNNNFLIVLILAFFISIILYFISLGSITFSPKLSEIAGISAFVLLIGFAIGSLLKRKFLIQGENISSFNVVSRLKDNSILILSIFLLFTLYKGLTMTKILPKIYSNEYPQAYFELVNKAESGKEGSVTGKYKYEEFKDKYDQFIEQTK